MKIVNLVKTTLLLLTFGIGVAAHSDETTLEKAELSKNQLVDGVKKSFRKTKDKTCKMFDGKLKCAAKKLKNNAKNMSDKIGTDAKELKSKLD